MPAVMKLRDEMAENSKNPYIQLIGDYLLQHLQQHPEATELILAKDKTIKGGLDAMKAEARKRQVDGCAMLTDEEGYTVVLRYFGLDPKVAAKKAPVAPAARPVKPSGIEFDVNLDELLGLPRG